MKVVTYSEQDREAAEHLLNTFEVDCGVDLLARLELGVVRR